MSGVVARRERTENTKTIPNSYVSSSVLAQTLIKKSSSRISRWVFFYLGVITRRERMGSVKKVSNSNASSFFSLLSFLMFFF